MTGTRHPKNGHPSPVGTGAQEDSTGSAREYGGQAAAEWRGSPGSEAWGGLGKLGEALGGRPRP